MLVRVTRGGDVVGYIVSKLSSGDMVEGGCDVEERNSATVDSGTAAAMLSLLLLLLLSSGSITRA